MCLEGGGRSFWNPDSGSGAPGLRFEGIVFSFVVCYILRHFWLGASHVNRLRRFTRCSCVKRAFGSLRSPRHCLGSLWGFKRNEGAIGRIFEVVMVRSAVVPIRFSKEERDSLFEQAKSFGVSLSEFVRRAALKRRLPPAPAPQINRDIYQELSRIGNNLNQVAKKIHEGAVSVDLELIGTLSELKGVVKSVGMKVLGVSGDSETE